MKNYINYRHAANIMNIKRGYSRPVKVNTKAFRLFNDLTEENMKLRFAPTQLAIEKRMNERF